MSGTISLDLTRTTLEMDIFNIAALQPDDFTMSRRNGLGGSDAATILGVSHYETRWELLQNKLATEITQEEREIATLPAVMRGTEMEPFVMEQFEMMTGWNTLKPTDQYKMVDFPFIKINFDGVIDDPVFEGKYIPAEIKVISARGEKNYNPTKAHIDARIGLKTPIKPIPNPELNYVHKANYYGIPLNYYCQLQVQMLGLAAPYGYIAALSDRTGEINVYHIWRDDKLINEFLVKAYQFWEEVVAHRARRGF